MIRDEYNKKNEKEWPENKQTFLIEITLFMSCEGSGLGCETGKSQNYKGKLMLLLLCVVFLFFFFF